MMERCLRRSVAGTIVLLLLVVISGWLLAENGMAQTLELVGGSHSNPGIPTGGGTRTMSSGPHTAPGSPNGPLTAAP